MAPPVGALERIRYRDQLLDQDCIVNSGLDLLWLTLAFQRFSKLRIVSITNEPPGASPHAYPLAYRSLLAPHISTAARPSEESVSHAVLVALTAASEAKLTLDTFDILLSCSAPMWEDDFDLESLHSDSTEVNVGILRRPGPIGNGPLVRLPPTHPTLHGPPEMSSPPRKLLPRPQPIRTAGPLDRFGCRSQKRLDLWFDAPAASLFRSLAARQTLPELAELTLAGLVTDLARAEPTSD